MPRCVLCIVCALLCVGFPAGCSTTTRGWAGDAGRIGLSREGKPLIALTVGHGPRRIYIIAGIHGDEPEGLGALSELRGELALPSHASIVTVRLLEDLNPDGSARGTRASGAGVDLNRAWPASNSLAGRAPQPEVQAALGDMERFDPQLIIVLHSSRSGPFVNFDGPARQMAEVFADGANAMLVAAGQVGRWRVRPEMGYPTPGSMGSYWGRDRGIAILTIEFARGATLQEVRPALVGGLHAVLGYR